MSRSKGRALVAVVVGAVLLIGGFATVNAMRRAQEFELSIHSYATTTEPRVLSARVEMHPDFAVVRTDADDEGDRVILHLSARQPTLWWSGGDYAEVRWVRVELDQPLDGRQLVDAVSGNPVPRA
jgi:hypothetical protein